MRRSIPRASGTAEDFVTRVEALAGRKAVRNIVEAEPLGPQEAMEVLVIAPCTGNTLAKLAHGITDGAVTMAAKGHLRNGKPLCLPLRRMTAYPRARRTSRCC